MFDIDKYFKDVRELIENSDSDELYEILSSYGDDDSMTFEEYIYEYEKTHKVKFELSADNYFSISYLNNNNGNIIKSMMESLDISKSSTKDKEKTINISDKKITFDDDKRYGIAC